MAITLKKGIGKRRQRANGGTGIAPKRSVRSKFSHSEFLSSGGEVLSSKWLAKKEEGGERFGDGEKQA